MYFVNERQFGRMIVTRKSKTYSFSPLGNKLRRKGVKSGIPDILIFENRGPYNGFAIELKVGRNNLSPHQVMWLHELAVRRWKTLVSRSLDEVIAEVTEYLEQR